MPVLTSALVTIEQLAFTYDAGAADSAANLFEGVSAVLAPGEVTVVIGPSGSGKTTLLRLVAGELTATSGQVRFHGDSSSQVGYVYQEGRLVPFLTAEENVELAGEFARGSGMTAHDALATVGLDGLGSRLPDQLSGGQRQRVALARALATSADLILVDEPTGSLDRHSAADVAAVLGRLATDGKRCLLVATHDPLVIERADHVIDLDHHHRSAGLAGVW